MGKLPRPPSSPQLHVVGLGLDGCPPSAAQAVLDQAGILVGARRHLAHFDTHPAQRWPLGDLGVLIDRLQLLLAQPDGPLVVILTSGDPLFFGLGRLLLAALPPEQLAFYPSVTAVQLAFSRLHIPWQDACILSVHGRSCEPLTVALQQGKPTIAVIGDPRVEPTAIAAMVQAAPWPYAIWCCENLGGDQERIRRWPDAAVNLPPPNPLHLWVLQRQPLLPPMTPPVLGIPDEAFVRFEDRPSLITKRGVRVLALAELQLQPAQTVWDIGAGTGSVSVEIARLVPTATVYAIEKTAVGVQLIRQNCDRFGLKNLIPVSGRAPAAIAQLPAPNRVFIGGSGGQLPELLDAVAARLGDNGRTVVATTTLESQSQLTRWLEQHQGWQAQHLQVSLARSVPVGAYQRLSPLNPTLLTALWRSA